MQNGYFWVSTTCLCVGYVHTHTYIYRDTDLWLCYCNELFWSPFPPSPPKQTNILRMDIMGGGRVSLFCPQNFIYTNFKHEHTHQKKTGKKKPLCSLSKQSQAHELLLLLNKIICLHFPFDHFLANISKRNWWKIYKSVIRWPGKMYTVKNRLLVHAKYNCVCIVRNDYLAKFLCYFFFAAFFFLLLLGPNAG